MRGSGQLSRWPPLSHTGRGLPSLPQLTSIRARGRLGMGGGATRVSGRCGRRRLQPQVPLHRRPQTDRACGPLRGSDAHVAQRPVRAPPRGAAACVCAAAAVTPAWRPPAREQGDGAEARASRPAARRPPSGTAGAATRAAANGVRVRPAAWRHLGRRTPARAGAAAARRLCVRRRSGDHGLAPAIARAGGGCGGAGELMRGAAAAVWCCRCCCACGRHRRACAACHVAALRVPRPLQCGRSRGTAACVCAAAAAITVRQSLWHVHGGGGGGAGESARGAAAAV